MAGLFLQFPQFSRPSFQQTSKLIHTSNHSAMRFGKKHIVLVKKTRGAAQQEDAHGTQQPCSSLGDQTCQRPEPIVNAAPSIPRRSPARTRPQSCTSITSISTGSSLTSDHSHRHSQYVPSLRRKHSPTCETLRELRSKQSEAALRNAYEAQTLAYLSDSYEPRPTPSKTHAFSWSGSESSAEDCILEVEEEEAELPAVGTQGWWTSSIYSPTPDKEWS